MCVWNWLRERASTFNRITKSVEVKRTKSLFCLQLHGFCRFIPATNNNNIAVDRFSLTASRWYEPIIFCDQKWVSIWSWRPDVFHWLIYENDHRVARSEQLTRATHRQPIWLYVYFSMQCHVIMWLIMCWIEIESKGKKRLHFQCAINGLFISCSSHHHQGVGKKCMFCVICEFVLQTFWLAFFRRMVGI